MVKLKKKLSLQKPLKWKLGSYVRIYKKTVMKLTLTDQKVWNACFQSIPTLNLKETSSLVLSLLRRNMEAFLLKGRTLNGNSLTVDLYRK